jgi:hypothetical protein
MISAPIEMRQPPLTLRTAQVTLAVQIVSPAILSWRFLLSPEPEDRLDRASHRGTRQIASRAGNWPAMDTSFSPKPKRSSWVAAFAAALQSLMMVVLFPSLGFPVGASDPAPAQCQLQVVANEVVVSGFLPFLRCRSRKCPILSVPHSERETCRTTVTETGIDCRVEPLAADTVTE